MSKNVTGADNPQGSPLSLKERYDPSETTRRAPSTKEGIIAYLNGAAHDASLNKGKRVRFAQKNKKWLYVLQSMLNKLDCNSWIYKEGKDRTVYVLETLCNDISFSYKPSSDIEKLFYVKGFFDAEGGVPRNNKRFYIQFAQKSKDKIDLLKSILEGLDIKCGKVHQPSSVNNPDYWRVYVLAKSHRNYAVTVGSLHPIKSEILYRRMVI